MVASGKNIGINSGIDTMKEKIDRLESTILFILSAAKEQCIANLSRFELMKLVYLIEVESMKFIGHKFIDNLNFVRETNGPVSYDIYRATEHLEKLGYITIEQVEGNPEYGHPRSCHKLSGNLPDLVFDDSETLYLNSVLDDYLGLTIKKLKAIAYGTEPMLEMIEEEKSKGVQTLKGKPINFNSVPLDEDILSGMMSS